MSVKKIIIISLVIVIILIFFCYQYFQRDHLKYLKGEIVYTKRNNTGCLGIYKISANGLNKKLLYQNNDSLNCNSSFPQWSEDGTKIYFTAMENKKWKRFVMDSDGNNVKVLENQTVPMITIGSREEDIIISEGNIYYNSKKIYSFKDYDGKFNMGAEESSWSPDKEYIVFTLSDFNVLSFFGKDTSKIMIIDKDGLNLRKLTDGSGADWKY